MEEPTKEELIAMASQLRKPEGEAGTEIGDFMNKANLAMNLHAIAVLNPKANESILEVGMGNGAFVKNILGLAPSIKYSGLDYSPLMVEESIKNNQAFVKENRASFHCGDICDIPFDDDSFHTIFTINTLYFWENHQQTIQELKRVLKPGGRLLIAIRPYHVLINLPVTKFNFDLMEDEKVITLFMDHGFNYLERTDLIEPELESSGKKYRLECMFLDFSIQN